MKDAPMADTRRPAILVVDDEHALLDMIKTLLERTDYEVLTSDNGESAL